MRIPTVISLASCFQLCVQENYRNNPFHNFRHCFCVAQMMYGMIHLCGLNTMMTKEDLGVLITAAICHDLDHPGYNNTYVSLTSSQYPIIS